MGVTDTSTVRCEGATPTEHLALFHVKVKDRVMSLCQFNHFEFNRGLRPSYRSPKLGWADFVGEAQAPKVFFHFSEWSPDHAS